MPVLQARNCNCDLHIKIKIFGLIAIVCMGIGFSACISKNKIQPKVALGTPHTY